MDARLTPVEQLGAAEIDAWRALAARAADPNPFFEADFVAAARLAFPEAEVELLVVEDASRWVACVPLERRSSFHRVPAKTLASWLHDYAFLGTPLIDAAVLDAAACALVRALLEAPGGARVAALELLRADGPAGAVVTAALEGMSEPRTWERYERALIERRDEPTYLEGATSGHHQRELGRLSRKLGRDLGGEVTLADRAGDPAAVERFLALESSGWKGRNGTALASDPRHADFFRDLCARYAELGRLHLFELAVGERVAAMKCDIRAGNGVFGFKIGFDDELRRYSPGLQLEARYFDAFHSDRDIAWCDSCTMPGTRMISRMWPDRRPIVSLFAPTKAIGSGTAVRAVETAQAVRARGQGDERER